MRIHGQLTSRRLKPQLHMHHVDKIMTRFRNVEACSTTHGFGKADTGCVQVWGRRISSKSWVCSFLRPFGGRVNGKWCSSEETATQLLWMQCFSQARNSSAGKAIYTDLCRTVCISQHELINVRYPTFSWFAVCAIWLGTTRLTIKHQFSDSPVDKNSVRTAHSRYEVKWVEGRRHVHRFYTRFQFCAVFFDLNRSISLLIPLPLAVRKTSISRCFLRPWRP